MSVFVNQNTQVLIQGITGTQASFHGKRSLDYGTKVVGGVTPGKGGTEHLGLPVFNTVKEAVAATKANASVMFVPARQVVSAVREGAEAELELMVCIADNVPIKDMLEVKAILKGTKTKLIGPNTPGIITPGEARLGIFPENIHKQGRVGIVSRSSTLTYEAVIETNRAGLGQSTVIGLGDDMIIGMDFVDAIQAFNEDDATDVIVMIGQMGGLFEEDAAAYYRKLKQKKKIIGFVAGNTIPVGHHMGYVGEVMANGNISVQDKISAMRDAGIIVVDNINDIHKELAKVIS
ncbi:MAG: succinate--CoA ligase subunit alpha [Alphaproteobacteria bacterium]|nr:succinate--CoA ligase subunit alpha [Alphaproteobacteria bacterium]